MNNDQNFLAEAYKNIYVNRFHSEEPFNEEMVNASSEEEEYKKSASKHREEAADIIRHKLKLEYGHKYREDLANKAIEHALGGKSEDCEAMAGEVDWKRKVNYSDHVEHGRRAAKWEIESGKKPTNPHTAGSPEADQWAFGYKQEKSIKHNEDAETHHCEYAAEGCRCGGCKECSKGEDTEELGPDPEDVKAYDDEKDARLEYYKKICRKIKNGEMMVGDFIEWCVDHDIMPLNGEEEEAVTVDEKVKGVTKKQQALAGAVCNKRIGKHKGNPSKLRELTKCMKGVEKSEVKYNYKPKKKK